MLDTFDRFNSFHDWIFAGYSANSRGSAVHLELVPDDFKEHKTIVFMDVTRCLVTDYGMENIVYSLDIFTDFDLTKFIAARQILDQSTPFDRGLVPKKSRCYRQALAVRRGLNTVRIGFYLTIPVSLLPD